MSTYKKIGVWQTAFLGDAVLTLPLLRALREHYPDAEIHFFVRAGVESVFTAQPEITEVHPFAKRGGQKGLGAAWRFGRNIARQGFDLWLSAHTSPRSALIARSTAIPRRIGYDTPWFNRLAYTETVPRRFDELEEIERLHQLLLPLDISLPAPQARLVPADDARADADRFFAEHCAGRKVLGVHPGSTWPTKCWPESHFSEIITRAANAGVQVLLFAGPDETEVAQRVADGADAPGLINLAGKLTLPRLAAYLGKLDAYLTNDSGPMHLAWTQDVPLVALFGPTVKSLGFFPRGANSTVAEIDLDCRPCGLHGHRRCPLDHFNCMKKLTPDLVWKELARKLVL